MNTLELAARKAWLANAIDSRYGRCESCRRITDDNGKLLFVARQDRARKYECLACWDGGGARDQGVSR